MRRTSTCLGIWVLGFGIFVGIRDLGVGFCGVEPPVLLAQERGLLDRVSSYVADFQERFGSVVAEERYEQRIRRFIGASASSSNTRLGETVLVSDFLLVQVPGEGWLPFRDVFERDGAKVRDREDRLSALFLNGSARSAFEQAKRIMDEGARYNIGNIQRNINQPTLALGFASQQHRTRFDFKEAGREGDDTVLEFKEMTRPTFVSTTNGRDLPVTGKFWVDAASGVIRRSELQAVDTGLNARIVVTYQQDATLGMWVPARMEERYRRGRDSVEVVGTATYSRFRRFQVSTKEDIQ
jgi:hypothetical protein